MADFVLLYTGGGMPESEEEQAKVMQAWNDWYGAIGASLKDGGNPFGRAKTVAGDGSVKDGATGTLFTGFTIVSSASLETAADREGLTRPTERRLRHGVRGRRDVGASPDKGTTGPGREGPAPTAAHLSSSRSL